MEDYMWAEVSSAREFGALLRATRKSSLRSLEVMQQKQNFAVLLSKSQLQRYEVGETLPNISLAQHLDRLYDADGWVELSLRSLWRKTWMPWRDEQRPPVQMHAGRWPANYSGPVWLKILPPAEGVGSQHKIDLVWGPWKREVNCALDERGLVLVTGKAVDIDGISPTCNVSVSLPVFVLFGAGSDVTGEVVQDIRSGWVRLNHF